MSEAATRLVGDDGSRFGLLVDRWHGDATPGETAVLTRAVAPVLDVGCGPGRHVLALARRGVMTLGVDASPLAADAARSRGAPVLQRSVFDRLPCAGRWGSALLLDGNIGIGGDPVALLRRLRALLGPNGVVIAELDGPGLPTRALQVRIESGHGVGPWFPWASVGVDDAARVADAAGFAVGELVEEDGRWFACLYRR